MADDQSQEKRGTIQHLEQAVDAEETDKVHYHIRQTLQLLGVERTHVSASDSVRIAPVL